MSVLSRFLFRLYAVERASVRQFVLNRVSKLEGGEFYSLTLRRIFVEYHQVDIGLYTHGTCFTPGAMDKHTKIGRYCSIARGCRIMNRNHPMEFKSTHAFFFNPWLAYCSEDRIQHIPIIVGNDVWIGAHALIMPHVRSIGHGAVVAAGAVVNKDVPPYAVVVGNPARVVRFRFPKEVIEELLASKWWEQPVEKLNITEFNRPYVAPSSGSETESWS